MVSLELQQDTAMTQFKENSMTGSTKLASVCAIVAVAGLMLVQSGSDFAPAAERPLAAAVRPDGCENADYADLLRDMIHVKDRVENAQRMIISGQLPHRILRHHPFENIAVVMDAGFKELTKLRRAGEMDADDQRLFEVFADTFAMVKQNVRLINQALNQPNVFESELNKDGLVMLARIGREASARFNA